MALMEGALRKMGCYIREGTCVEHMMMPSPDVKADTCILTCSCLGLYGVAMAELNSLVGPLP